MSDPMSEENANPPATTDTEAAALQDFGDQDGGAAVPELGAQSAQELGSVFNVPVRVAAVLGKTKINISRLMQLGPGAIVELDRKVGEAIDVYVNNRLVARGEIVIVEDRLGLTMTEIIQDE